MIKIHYYLNLYLFLVFWTTFFGSFMCSILNLLFLQLIRISVPILFDLNSFANSSISKSTISFVSNFTYFIEKLSLRASSIRLTSRVLFNLSAIFRNQCWVCWLIELQNSTNKSTSHSSQASLTFIPMIFLDSSLFPCFYSKIIFIISKIFCILCTIGVYFVTEKALIS